MLSIIVHRWISIATDKPYLPRHCSYASPTTCFLWDWQGPPFSMLSIIVHRWISIATDKPYLPRHCSYASPTTCFLWDWRCAAIAHHSFLYHIRRGNLEAYSFPSWDFSYAAFDRWSINFFIFNSSDIPPSPLPTDDEVSAALPQCVHLEPAKGLEVQVHHLINLGGWNDVISMQSGL
jgi:hypothetical protein